MSKWSSIANSRAEAQTIYFQRKEINRLKNKTELQKQEIKGLKNHLEQLKVDLQEANDSAEWWNNRYNAIERQITNNWNELEEWLNKVVKITANIDEKMTCKNVLDKMKEIKEKK